MATLTNGCGPPKQLLSNGLKTQDRSFEPVAVVGMGCRWPGDSSQPSELWEFLEAEKDAYDVFPADRINVDAFYHEKKGRPGSFYTRGGCFLKSDPRKFDHTFFGINPQEAMSIDPAQRKLLETVYEAFESAGVPLEKVSGSNTGCFIGNFNYDHQLMQYRDAEYSESYSVTGGGLTILSNRINYVFNLKGPSMTLDTACSSSMYALHLACSAIQAGDCSAAVVAGSNLILTPECQLASSTLGAVSPTSRCHSFDAAADGYARADGIGALYIKRLEHALQDKDPIRAIIRGTAINANGKTGGITHPSSDGQETVIRQAYERAGGLDPTLTGYFECHGTGTAVGDPLEMAAIARVFAPDRTKSNPLLVGSIKSNMGHSEPVSGIAGIMKAILALEHGIIPPTIGFVKLNPNIDLKNGRISIVTKSTPWPNLPARRASVNSFGYGGANAHTILEAVDSFIPGYKFAKANAKTDPSTDNIKDGFLKQQQVHRVNGYVNGEVVADIPHSTSRILGRDHFLLAFSAHNESTLRSIIAAVREKSENYHLIDLAYTLGVRRSRFSNRSFVVAKRDNVKKELDRENIVPYKSKRSQPNGVGFVFTGQGAQWSQMGLDLMDTFPSFLGTVRQLDSFLHELEEPPTWTLEEILRHPLNAQNINKGELSQPATTAIQIALVNLLSSWNIKPVVTVGHSSGEIGAAYAAGLVTARYAIIIAYLRGKAIILNKKHGSMLAVGVMVEEYKSDFQDRFDNVVVACHNSPESITLSGDTGEIMAVKEILEANKVFTRVLVTDGNAYHSPHMIPVGSIYEKEIIQSRLESGIQLFQTPEVSLISTVTGRLCTKKELGAKYWRSNLESPVLFEEALEELVRTTSVDTLIEIGPHTALRSPIQQIARSVSNIDFPEYVPTLIRSNDGVKNVLDTAGILFAKGYPVDLERVNAIEVVEPKSNRFSGLKNGSTIVDLPRYQWQYQDTFFSENRWTREWRLRQHARHDLLGSRIPGGVKDDPTWRNILRPKDLPWLRDHQLESQVVFPAAGYLSMALEAATQVIEIDGIDSQNITSYELRDIILHTALIVPDNNRGVELLLALHPVSLSNNSYHKYLYTFIVTSVTESNNGEHFIEHARGHVGVNFEDSGKSKTIKSDLVAKTNGLLGIALQSGFSTSLDTSTAKKEVSAPRWYKTFAQTGLNYGPAFQGLSGIKAYGNNQIAEANISLNPTAFQSFRESRYVLHPAALDAAIQLSIIATHSGMATRLKRPFLPVNFEHITVWPLAQEGSGKTALSVAKGTLSGGRGLYSNLHLVSESGRPILDAQNLLLLSTEPRHSLSSESEGPYSRMVWKPAFDFLSTESVTALYPLVTLDDSAVIPSVVHLALLLLVQFYDTYLASGNMHSEVPHMEKYLIWVRRTIELARENQYPRGREVLEYSRTERAEKIEMLSSSLNKVSSESRLMCRIYQNLPDIIKGAKSGIQVALQDNLLLDLYGDGHGTREGNKRLAAIVDLLSHSQPGLQILEVGAGTGSATHEVLAILNGDSIFRRYKTYAFTDITTSFLASAEERFKKYHGVTFSAFDMEKPSDTQGVGSMYNLVIASNSIHATSDILTTLSNIRSLLQSGGKLILLENTRSLLSTALTVVMGTFSDFWKGDEDKNFPRIDGPFLDKAMWSRVLQHSGFSGLDFFLDDYAGRSAVTVLVATAADPNKLYPSPQSPKMEELTIIHRNTPPTFISALSQHAQSQGYFIQAVSLDTLEPLRSKRLVFVAEMTAPIFNDITAAEWSGLQTLLKSASSALWVTNGGLLKNQQPMFAMISGIARGISTEMNHLRLSLLDLDQEMERPVSKTCELILQFEKIVADKSTENFTEHRHRDGIIFTSRLQADHLLNESSRAEAEHRTSEELTCLDKLKNSPFQLDIERPGVLSTVYFREDHGLGQPLDDDCIEIEVKAIGMNNRDLAVLSGKFHFNSLSVECAGIVTQTGKAVTDIAIGDRVMCLSLAKYGNYVRAKASACQKYDSCIAFEDLATMPLAFCTAIYGLMTNGNLKKGETVLIQSATGGVGIAAIQIANLCGAEIYATVGSQAKKQELLDKGFGIQEDHVFWSRDKSTPSKIMSHTNGKGIDVILSSSHDEQLHEYWRCVASFGRFVDIGRIDVINHANLSMDAFNRHAAFMSFDLSVVSIEKPEIIASLMATIKKLHEQGLISPIPCKCFHVSEIANALAFWAKNTRTGKVVVTYEHTNAGIKFRKSPYKTSFDPDATYLLVGCLGGLGQLYSRWMVDRGARNLTYLSRSGVAKAEIRDFIAEIENRGVIVHVVKGDVTNLEDVKRAVACSGKSVKGVVQAALTLQDRLFENMTLDMFNATVKPRVTGTINLHLALENSPLEFFMMWTSWTCMFGTATQSNYLGSCSFMDSFARYRRSLGLCATSLSLNQILDVGAISRVPGYDIAMARNGLYGNDEDEFLQYCDAAITCSPASPQWAHDPCAEAHLLTGIEPARLQELDKEYPLQDMEWHRDARFSNLVQATQILASGETGVDADDDHGDGDLGASDRIHKRLSQLLYVPMNEIVVTRPINDYGIDSMIAAELKNWLFKTFAVDVSMFSLLDPAVTVMSLAAGIGPSLP